MKPRSLRTALFPLPMSLVASCFQSRAEWETALRSRAAFELRCDGSQLSIHALTTETLGTTHAPLYQGVEGCGMRAVYVATARGYVLNSSNTGNQSAVGP